MKYYDHSEIRVVFDIDEAIESGFYYVADDNYEESIKEERFESLLNELKNYDENVSELEKLTKLAYLCRDDDCEVMRKKDYFESLISELNEYEVYKNEDEDEDEEKYDKNVNELERFEKLMKLIDLYKDEIDVNFDIEDLYYFDDYDKYDFMQSEEVEELMYRLRMMIR